MRLSALLLLLFSLHLGSLQAQFNQAETFDVTHGMAMTESTSVYCDKKGHIWTLHNNYYLSCFDGNHFTTFSPEVTGYYAAGAEFAEDTAGLWIYSNEHQVSLYDGIHWKSWKTLHFLSGHLDKAANRMVFVDTTGQLLYLDAGSKSWRPCGKLPAGPDQTRILLNASLKQNLFLLRFIRYKPDINIPKWSSGNTNKKTRSKSTIEVIKAFTSPSLVQPHWTVSQMKNTDFDFSTLYMHSFAYEDLVGFKSIPFTSDPDVLYTAVQTSHDHNLLYTSKQYPHRNVYDVTIYTTNAQFELVPVARILHSEFKLAITTGQSGRLWIASQAGLMRVYPHILLCHENDHNMVPSIHVINEDNRGNIWFGGYGSGLCYFDGQQIHKPPPEAAPYRNFLPGSYRDTKGNMMFWEEHHRQIRNVQGQWSHNTVPGFPLGGGYYYHPLSSGQVAAGLGLSRVAIIQNVNTPVEQWSYIDKSKGQLLDNVLTITEDKAGRLWMGRTGQGVSIYDPLSDTARTWLIQPGTSMNFGMLSSTLDAHGRLWMGCSDGIRVILKPDAFRIFEDDVPTQTLKLHMDEAGYSTVTLLKVYQRYLVFGNYQGYGFVDLASFEINPDAPRIYFYPTGKFLQSCDQNTIYIQDDHLIWIGQDRGAMRIDMNQHVFDTFHVRLLPPVITIQSNPGYVTSLPMDKNLYARLPLKKRSFTLHIQTHATGWLNDNLGFQYRIINHFSPDAPWSDYSKSREIKIDYLPQGKSIFQLRAIKNNEVHDEMELAIMAPLTLDESPYFWITLFGIISLAGLIIVRHNNMQKLKLKQAEIKLSEERREKEQFQVRAIANSLNPHFIKNSLNWAQTRFRSDLKAATVIDELSSNITTIFKRSREGQAFHSLAEEFEIVRNYLSIQQATYGDYITIVMPPPETIEAHKKTGVPLLQIQIHVENAIEHGIRNRIGAHILEIKLEEEDAYLHLTITDDGIGRQKAAILGSHGTQQGVHMLNSLHTIYNSYNALKFSCYYEDLPWTDPKTGKLVGTRVHVLIPKIYNYEIHEDH